MASLFEKILEKLAAANAQKLNWRTSIVEPLKLLDLNRDGNPLDGILAMDGKLMRRGSGNSSRCRRLIRYMPDS